MAAYDFPDTAGKPTDGSFNYTAPDGTLYEWNGYAWEVPGGSGGSGGGGGDFDIPTQALPPQVAEDGDLWWCTDDGRLYIYYEDVDTTQWVDASPDNGGAGSGDSSDSIWERTSSTINPVNAGDDVEIGSGNITLNADGSAAITGNFNAGGNPNGGAAVGSKVRATGQIQVTGANGSDNIWEGFNQGVTPAGSTISSDGRATFAGGDISFDNVGGATFAGNKVVITSSGNVKAGDPDNSQGSVLSPVGQNYARNDGGNSAQPAYAVYNGSLDSAGKYAAINFDGSAVFSQGNISFLANGNAQFGPSTAGKVVMEGMGTTQGELIISNPTGSNSYNCFRVVSQTNNTIVFKQGGDATFAGALTLSGTYNSTSGPSPRALQIGNDGRVSGLASTRAAKKNIEYDYDTSWVRDLKPVSYNYRVKDEVGAYTSVAYESKEYGLIAEDVELVNPAICNYGADDELVGVEYSRLISPILSQLQTALTRIEALEAEVQSLKGGNS